MPAPRKNPGGFDGITWKEVQAAEEEYCVHYNCRVEWIATWEHYGGVGGRRWFTVTCYAISGREGPGRLIGSGDCPVGANRGASTVPGAFLRSLLVACEDLARRRLEPRYNRDTPVVLRKE